MSTRSTVRARGVAGMIAALLLGAACGGDDAPAATTAPPVTDDAGEAAGDTVGSAADDEFPDIVEATATYDDSSDTWTFAVTVSSPYDTPERYADGWRVVAPDGEVLGVHTLLHDHANEQPFTRRQTGVVVPDHVDRVTIEGRDQANGFGGDTVTVELSDR